MPRTPAVVNGVLTSRLRGPRLRMWVAPLQQLDDAGAFVLYGLDRERGAGVQTKHGLIEHRERRRGSLACTRIVSPGQNVSFSLTGCH